MGLRRLVALVVLLLGSAFPTVARASTWRLVSVAQPLLGEGAVLIADVPYGVDCCEPGAEVALTCEPNAIRSVYAGAEGETENLNAASMVGLTIEAGPLWNGHEYFDTLTVTLDATHADSIARAQGFAPDSVIAATVMCLRINAGRSVFPAGIPDANNQRSYLRLRLLGPARIGRFARTYKIALLGLPERTYDLGPSPER